MKRSNSELSRLEFPPTYNNLSLDDAITQYAPPNENDTANYQQLVQKALGLSGNIKLSTLTQAQKLILAQTIQRIEGWNVGTEGYSSEFE